MAMSAREHLDWAAERALEYYDRGEEDTALASFLSDVGKHPDTRYIQTHPLGMPLVLVEIKHGREAFKQAMTGFSA